MSIGIRIKELRESLGMTRLELADKLGITVAAISNYENNISSPKEAIMFKLMEVLNCDANYLFQDVVNIPKKLNDVTISEFEQIKKYRTLDERGKSTVDTILNMEYKRALESENSNDTLKLVGRGGASSISANKEELAEAIKKDVANAKPLPDGLV